jgi:type I restriction enzyme S subunit
MAGEWELAALGPKARKIGSGATPRGGREAYLDAGPVALIRSENVLDFSFSREGLAFIDGDQAAALSNVEVNASDVLINITGDSVARVCMVDPDVLPARVNQHVAIIRADPAEFDQRFLFYSLVEPRMKQQLLSLASAGATRNALTKGDLERLKIARPAVCEQRAIANLLGGLDDKIALNRRMAETLEAMAGALFRSWFVDFDPVRAKAEGRPTGLPHDLAALFPDRLGDDGLPAGWVLEPLDALAEVNPPTKLTAGIVAPYVDMSALSTSSARVTSWIRRAAGSGARFQNNDTLVARITPCLENGKTALVDFLPDGQIGWGSTEFIVLRPRRAVPPAFPYLLARSEPFRLHLIGSMTGTSGRQRVPPAAVVLWDVAIPDPKILEAFGQAVGSIFARVRAADTQSQSLGAVRDALLPKLISGKLRIADAKKSISAA